MPAISYCQSDPAYRADPSYAQSHVKHILKSPAHFLAAKKQKFSPTLTMQIGSALHCLVLEGIDQFTKDFVLKPDNISLATKEGKEWKQSIGKKTILSRTDQYASWDAVMGMADSLSKLDWFDQKQKDYRKFNELSLYWEADGVDCKCRLDRLVIEDGRALILDLKTTDSIDSKDFLRKIIGGMNYLFQSAWYSEGVLAAFNIPSTFYFIAIERTPPYATKIFEVSEEMLAEGLEQTKYARNRLSQCLKQNKWESPEIQHETLSLPPWFTSPLDSDIITELIDPLDLAFKAG